MPPGEAHFAQVKARRREPMCAEKEEEEELKGPGLDKHIEGRGGREGHF